MRSNSTSYASSSIISAVAALESNINEILTDVLITDKLTKLSRIEVLFSKTHDNVLLDKLTNKYNRFLKGKYNEYKTDVKIYERFSKPGLPIIFKYDIMSCVLAKDLVPDSPIKSDVILLIKIRNFLVHYNIEVEEKINEDTIRFTEKKIEQLEKQIKNKNRFTLSPLFNDVNNPFFPNKVICAGSAEWAYNTANGFIEYYRGIINN